LRDLCADPAVTAQSVAQALNISVRTVHRALTATNETFGALLMAQRVELALRMLMSSSFNHLTTAEIGRRAGFSDPSHFVRVFRRHTGQTPGERRRQ
jgi:AraC-like DNA-binding protein